MATLELGGARRRRRPKLPTATPIGSPGAPMATPTAPAGPAGPTPGQGVGFAQSLPPAPKQPASPPAAPPPASTLALGPIEPQRSVTGAPETPPAQPPPDPAPAPAPEPAPSEQPAANPRPQPPTKSRRRRLWEAAMAAWNRYTQAGKDYREGRIDENEFTRIAEEIAPIGEQYRTEYGVYAIFDREPPDGPPGPDDPDYAAYLADVTEWERQEEIRLRGLAEDALNRQTEVRWEPDENGVLRPVAYYRDGPDGEWQIDPDADMSGYRQPVDTLDRINKRIEGAPEDTFAWMRDQQEKGAPWGQWNDLEDLKTAANTMLEKWRDGSITKEAFEEAAYMLGFQKTEADGDIVGDVAAYANWINKELTSAPAGSESQSSRSVTRDGMTDDERALRNYEFQSSQRLLMDHSDRAVDAVLGESGSVMRAFATKDYYVRQLHNAAYRHRVSMIQEDVARMTIQSQQSSSRITNMVQLGLMAQDMAKATIVQERAHQMQGWAMMFSTALSQNQQTLAVSANDRAITNSLIQQDLALFNAQLGLTETVERGRDRDWERYVRPHLMKLDHQLRVLTSSIQREATGIGAMMQQRALDQQDRHFQEQMKFARENQPSFLESLIGGIFGLGGTVLSGWAMGGFKMPGSA